MVSVLEVVQVWELFSCSQNSTVTGLMHTRLHLLVIQCILLCVKHMSTVLTAVLSRTVLGWCFG
jgi:hypothetical protein